MINFSTNKFDHKSLVPVLTAWLWKGSVEKKTTFG